MTHKRSGTKYIVIGIFALIITLIIIDSRLPSLETRESSTVVTDTENTRIGKAIAPFIKANPEKSGIYALPDAGNAFASRVLAAQAAERTLDVQYYIWHKDTTGILLFKALRDAADRGVRVRLLLDDNNTTGLDEMLAVLDSHPNIEVRLFNPFMIRKPRWIGYLTDFSRLNRRMHNKSFTVDNQVTIVGGRNIGDEYFGAANDVVFEDLDVMATGPVVQEVSKEFDRYWASQSAYPIDKILPSATEEMKRHVDDLISQIEHASTTTTYIKAVQDSLFVRELTEGKLELEWVKTHMISDDPGKGLGLAKPENLFPQELREVVGNPSTYVDLVSPYFVLSAPSVELFKDMSKRGVKMRVLTNALEATDVAPVHAGYSKKRKTLLASGIKIYELKRLSTSKEAHNKSLSGSGSSASSLHAKTFSVDHSRVFIGSFNFDPRSANLNTEIGFVIDSPTLAKKIESVLNQRIPVSAYEVRLSKEGNLYWLEQRDGKLYKYEKEPNTTAWDRTVVFALSLLPIEWML